MDEVLRFVIFFNIENPARVFKNKKIIFGILDF